MNGHQLEEKLLTKHMVVCVGPGGVGKTTFAAALAVRAAHMGRRVACLTIDPARRLGDILGFETDGTDDDAEQSKAAMGSDALHDVTSLIASRGGKGTLHVGMLDAQRTFDAVVRKRSSSAERAERILNNRLYRYVSGSLSGLQEYMALERLCQLQENTAYDFIVLDTPPSDNVVDFFAAPTRMREALAGPLVRMMRSVYGGQGAPGLDFLGKWAFGVFNVLSRITGASLLDEIVAFVEALSDLFGTFSERADQIETMLKSTDVEVLMITRPDSASANETADLQGILEKSGFHVDGLVLNQCTYPEITGEIPADVCEPCRSEMAALNRNWNRVYQKEKAVISEVVDNAGFRCVCLIPLLPFNRNRLDMLFHIWRSLTPIKSPDL